MSEATRTRIGGHVVVESLEALGAEAVFGLPGVHALGIWDGLRDSRLRYIGLRTELNAAFAADGYARAGGKPAALLLSTGPGALNSLTGLMEAASAHVPLVAIASQIPRDLIGRGRGYLHELRDQRASFEPVVKWATRARSAEHVPELLAEAWLRARTPPSGPVFLEIPVDVLTGETEARGAGLLGIARYGSPDLVFNSPELLGASLQTDARGSSARQREAAPAPPASNVQKKATLETGAEISVPAFINIGDRVKVDTRTGEYLERVRS